MPSAIRPRLTEGGKQRHWLRSDAPARLKALGRTQVPDQVHGRGMRGGWVRGWCDGFRLRDVNDNPYLRGGSGWHHAMGNLYLRGWRAGKLCARIDRESDGLSDREYRRLVELRDRATDAVRAAAQSVQSTTTTNP